MSVPIQTLMDYLRSKYMEHLAKLSTKAKGSMAVKEIKKEAFEAADAYKAYASVPGFIRFCEEQLVINPAISAWFPGSGLGLVLADSTKLVMTNTAAPTPGQMQDSPAIGITSGEAPTPTEIKV